MTSLTGDPLKTTFTFRYQVRRRFVGKLRWQFIPSVVCVQIENDVQINFSEFRENSRSDSVDSGNSVNQIFQLIRRYKVSLVDLGLIR